MCQLLYTLYTLSHLFISLNETMPTNTELRLKYLAVLSLLLTIDMLLHQKTLETNG